MSEQTGLPWDEVRSRLEIQEDYDPGGGPGPCVHTFVAAPFAIGAHWRVADVERAVDDGARIVEHENPSMLGVGHGLVLIQETPNRSRRIRKIYLETKR